MDACLLYARILVPVDGSEGALRAAQSAGEIARVTGSTIDFLYVTPFDERTDDGAASWLPETVTASASARAQEIFSAAAAVLPAGVAYSSFLRVGSTVEEILRFADEEKSALIAIGGRKTSRVSGILLGSVSQAVLERAHTRILVAGRALVLR